MTEDKERLASYVVISLVFVHFMTSQSVMGSIPDITDPFEHVRSRTSQVLVTVKGRDPRRHLTTYEGIDGDPTSQLEFGFPLVLRRRHRNDRLELMDASSSIDQQQNVKKVTLRHPWDDVYMTSDAYHSVSACQYVPSARRNVKCVNSPYVYLEKWNVTDECFRMRLNVRRGAKRGVRVAYAYVTDATWELRLRPQATLVTNALAAATKRAWKESVDVLLSEQVGRLRRKKRKRRKRRHQRHRRCVADPRVIKNRLVNDVTIDALRREIRKSLKRNRHCVVDGQNQTNYDVISTVPWKIMTSEVKTSLVCHVGYIVRKRLRNALIGLAATRCVRLSKWGRMVEKKRRSLLDRYLGVAWLQRKTQVEPWLVDIVQSSMESAASAFCIDRVT